MMGMVSQQDFAALAARVEALEQVIKSKDAEIAAIRRVLDGVTRPLMVYGAEHQSLSALEPLGVWCSVTDHVISG